LLSGTRRPLYLAFLAAAAWFQIAVCSAQVADDGTFEALDAKSKTALVAALRKELNDPYSVHLGEISVKAPWMCGALNAKNAMGTYTGSVDFLLNIGSGYFIMSTDNAWKQMSAACPDEPIPEQLLQPR